MTKTLNYIKILLEDIMEEKKEIYVCIVCGYEAEGPLPEDYICPLCGVDVTHFVLKED